MRNSRGEAITQGMLLDEIQDHYGRMILMVNIQDADGTLIAWVPEPHVESVLALLNRPSD